MSETFQIIPIIKLRQKLSGTAYVRSFCIQRVVREGKVGVELCVGVLNLSSRYYKLLVRGVE